MRLGQRNKDCIWVLSTCETAVYVMDISAFVIRTAEKCLYVMDKISAFEIKIKVQDSTVGISQWETEQTLCVSGCIGI